MIEGLHTSSLLAISSLMSKDDILFSSSWSGVQSSLSARIGGTSLERELRLALDNLVSIMEVTFFLPISWLTNNSITVDTAVRDDVWTHWQLLQGNSQLAREP